MKYCQEYAALLDPFVDEELSPEEAARVRAHLKVCGGCRSYVDAALAMREAFPDPEDIDVPEDFADRVMDAVRAESTAGTRDVFRRRSIPWKKALLPIAACLAVAVAVGQLPRLGASTSTADAAACQTSIASASNESIAESPAAAEDAFRAESAPAESGDSSAERHQAPYPYATADNSAVSFASGADDGLSRQSEKIVGAEALWDLSGEYRSWTQVSLTPEQTERLLSAYAAESQPDGGVRYVLTAEQFDAVVAALNAEGIQLEIHQQEDTDSEFCCLLLPPEN